MRHQDEIDTYVAAGAAASAPIQLLFFCFNFLPGRFPTRLLCFVPFVAYALGASFHVVFFNFFWSICESMQVQPQTKEW